MEFDGFEWDEGNRGKCLKHGVSVGEIEEALSVIEFVVDDPFAGDEKRYRTVGRRPEAGRYVFAAFTVRKGRDCVRSASATCTRRRLPSYEEEMARVRKR